MRVYIMFLVLILTGSPANGLAGEWNWLRQAPSQTLLSSPGGAIYIESGQPMLFSESIEFCLLKFGQAIYPDGQIQAVDSPEQLAPNLWGQNFLVSRACYLPPEIEKLRVILYSEAVFSVKFMGTTRNLDFDFLESNVDFLARDFYKNQNPENRKISESAPDSEF